MVLEGFFLEGGGGGVLVFASVFFQGSVVFSTYLPSFSRLPRWLIHIFCRCCWCSNY
jgi:hypothetical protein